MAWTYRFVLLENVAGEYYINGRKVNEGKWEITAISSISTQDLDRN